MALAHIHFRFVWQVWRLATSTCIWRGRRGTCGTGLALVARLVAVSRSGRRGTFAWQAWRLLTSTFVFRGSRGTWRHLPAFGVAGGALVALGWLWWRTWSLCRPGLCVAGVALAHIHLRFAHLWHWAGSGGALGRRWRGDTLWHSVTSTFVLRGRRSTWRHLLVFGVAGAAFVALCWLWWLAGVALALIHLRFSWQAWRLATSTCVWCGRRGAWWHWAGSGGALGRC